VTTSSVLLLNADYTPIQVIGWEKAIVMILESKVTLVAGYVGRFIHTASKAMEWPAVVALNRYKETFRKLRFNRFNILARDSYTCNYCGVAPKNAEGRPLIDQLTLDHIVPRAQSKNGMVTLPWNGKRVTVTCWENVVTACYTCNHSKADRTPEQAKMKLRRIPNKPTPWDTVRMSIARTRIPEEWMDYLPQAQDLIAWRDYWNVELDPT
jgi:5-methylcytosine-specific restriction endonuclease McrA